MKQLLRLIMCTLLCLLTPLGIRAEEPSFATLLPKNSNSLDRIAIKLEAENKKKRDEKIPIPVNQKQQKPAPANTPISRSVKSTINPTSWESSMPTNRLLLGFGAGALAAYLVDRMIFAGDYTAEIALEHKNLRDYIAQREEIRGKTEHETEYAELTELIRETRRHLAQLKALKHARAIIAPLVIVATVAASILPITKK